MPDELLRLRSLIEDGGLLAPKLFAGASTVALLAERDAVEFDREWVRVHSELSSLTADTEVPDVKAIREAVFVAVFRETHEPELAACASDDFGLIAAALTTSYDDPWLTGLWLSYKNGRFPRNEINRVSQNIRSTI